MAKASQVSALAAILERVGTVRHPASDQLRSNVARLHSVAADIDKVRSSRSLAVTEAAHALAVAKQARRFDPQITAILGSAGDQFRMASEALSKRIAEKVNFKIDREDAREVREVVRAMKPADRVKALDRMLKTGNGPELHAILSGTELTTGVDDGMRAAFRDSFVATHAAEEMAEQEALQQDFDSVCAAARAAGSFVRELTDPGKLAEIERSAAEADAALAALNQSLQ